MSDEITSHEGRWDPDLVTPHDEADRPRRPLDFRQHGSLEALVADLERDPALREQLRRAKRDHPVSKW